MARGNTVDLRAVEEHLEGVLIGEGVPPIQRKHFKSFEIVMARAFNRSPSYTIRELCRTFKPSELVKYAEEVEVYVQKLGIKETLRRLLNHQTLD